MHSDEARILESGLQINIVDLLIFDSVEFYLSRIDFQKQWTETPSGLFCWVNIEQILKFNQFRLQGICNNERAIRRKLAKLVELGLFEQYQHNSKTLLRQGPTFNLLSDKFDMADLNNTAPTLDKVKEYFKEKGFTDPEGFFKYNEKRGWRRSGFVVNETMWHSFAEAWDKKATFFSRCKKKSQQQKSAAAVVSKLPLSLPPDRFLALGPEYQLKYVESKDRGGNTVYVLKAS